MFRHSAVLLQHQYSTRRTALLHETYQWRAAGRPHVSRSRGAVFFVGHWPPPTIGVSGAFPSASSVRPHRLPSVPPPLPRPRPVQLPRPLPALRLRTARVSGAFRPSASSAHPHPLPSRPPPLPHPRPPRRREFVQLPHRRLPRLHASAGPLRALRLRTPRVAAPHLRHASPWPWYPWPCGCETTVKRWRTKCPPGITSSSGHNRSPLVLCVSIAHTCGQEFTRREYSFRCSLQYRHTFCA